MDTLVTRRGKGRTWARGHQAIPGRQRGEMWEINLACCLSSLDSVAFHPFIQSTFVEHLLCALPLTGH